MAQPVRAEINLVFVDEDLRAADRVLGLRDLLEERGFILEASLIEKMDPGDVVPGSPLAALLDNT